VRQAGFLERPLRPQVLGLAAAGGKDVVEGVERDHAGTDVRLASRRRAPRVTTTRLRALHRLGKRRARSPGSDASRDAAACSYSRVSRPYSPCSVVPRSFSLQSWSLPLRPPRHARTRSPTGAPPAASRSASPP